MERWLRAFGMPVLLVSGVVALVGINRAKPGRRWVVLPAAEVAAVENPHAYKGAPVCQRCHPNKDVRLAADPDAACMECHKFHNGNHPVGVKQVKPAEVPLPLGPGHTVACHSCHDPHDVTRLPDGLRLPFNDLCVACHPGR